MTAPQDEESAKAILSSLTEDPSHVLGLPSLGHTRNVLRQIQQRDPAGLDSIGRVLAHPADRSRLVERAWLTPLADLTLFLDYVEHSKPLKPVFDALADQLAGSNRRAQLVDRALVAPLRELASFLDYVEHSRRLHSVFDVLAAELEKPERRTQLVDRALLTPLGNLEAFLAYAGHSRPLRPIVAALASELARAERRPQLANCVLLTPLGDVASFLDHAEHSKPLRPVFDALVAELDQAERRTQLVHHALLSPLGDLALWLAYVEHSTPLRPLFDALAAELSQAERQTQLILRALLAPLPDLSSLLASIEHSESLAPVFNALAAALGQPERRSQLAERILLAPLADLASFLAFVEHSKPLKPVFDALAGELALAKRRPQLVGRALVTPLGDLVVFLGRVEHSEPLKPVFDALTAELAQAEHCAQLVERALRAPLAEVASLLTYVQHSQSLRPVFDALAAALAEHHPQLVERFTSTDLYQLVTILSDESTRHQWTPVLLDVSAKEWERRHMGDAIDPEAFVHFHGLMTTLGRPELALVPAATLVRRADAKRWHRPGIGIRHVSHVVSCAHSADGEMLRFLERIATPDWIDAQLGQPSTGGLAGSLQTLSVALSADLRRFFLRPALRDRIIREAAVPQRHAPEWEEILALLGAAAACGLHVDALDANWPGPADLVKILQTATPDLGRTRIGRLQTELWLGLREMARLRIDAVAVPAEHGDRILSLWRAAQGTAPDHGVAIDQREANASMIKWLDECRANAWTLVR